MWQACFECDMNKEAKIFALVRARKLLQIIVDLNSQTPVRLPVLVFISTVDTNTYHHSWSNKVFFLNCALVCPKYKHSALQSIVGVAG